jgi:hypothetical protein
MIAVAIVIANCLKNSYWTRHKGNWNKTAAIKNVIAIIAPAISCIAFLVAFNGIDVLLPS